LDEIDLHPFLAESHVPTFLPTSVLSLSPVWRVNEYGELVCTDKASDYVSGKKPAIPRSHSLSVRRPFSSHDPNQNKAASSATTMTRKIDINMDRVIKSAVAAMSVVTSCSDRRDQKNNLPSSSAVAPAFEIFDESQSQRKMPPKFIKDEVSSRDESNSAVQSNTFGKRQTPPQSTLTEDYLCQQTQALSVQCSFPSQSLAVTSSVFSQATESVFSSTDSDAEIFKLMMDHLDAVLKVVESRKVLYRSSHLRSVASRYGPLKWVVRYVDYTCKYGLGFLLNDGSSGVYFNDATKTALSPQSDTFQYIERKRSDLHQPKLKGVAVVETHSLHSFPEALKKKVTLLKHFRNYLIQQEPCDVAEEEHRSEAICDGSDGKVIDDLVYVKKWVRTKHSILFSLSNRTIQVIFYDQTEILLTPDIAYLTYVDKQRQRFTYHFTDELVGLSPEIEKRLRYVKDIMLQLLAASHKH
jgi:POLO box duplicated region